MRVLVTGASGFVGGRLCPALEGAGHEVLAMTRSPERYPGAGRPVAGEANEVVVRDDSIRKLVPFDPMDYDEMVLAALGERAKAARE